MVRKDRGRKSRGTKGRGRIVITGAPIVKMRVRQRTQLDERTSDVMLNSPDTHAAGGLKAKRGKAIDSGKIQKRFGDRVRAIRHQKDISQEALALVCELDRAYIGGVERGERNISLVNIYKIARGLNVPAKELMP